MFKILRDPGAEVVVGMGSFAVVFAAIGLSLAAPPLSNITFSYVAFGIAAALFILTVCLFVSLLTSRSKTRGHIKRLGEFILEGRKLRKELLSVKQIPQWTLELQKKVPDWEEGVQLWLDNNLPEHAMQFDLEHSLIDFDTSGINSDAAEVARHLEGRMLNLKEILSDIRT